MKIILSLSLAARTVMVALAVGFVLGAVVGYRAGASTGYSRIPGEPAGDVRAVPDHQRAIAARPRKPTAQTPSAAPSTSVR